MDMEKKRYKSDITIEHDLILDDLVGVDVYHIINDLKIKCIQSALNDQMSNFQVGYVYIDTTKDITDELYYNDYLRELYLTNRSKNKNYAQVIVTAW